jgi:ABC-type multidrug transport system fused ATPase/permease subunit
LNSVPPAALQVGPSGSGKSTIAALLNRFYRPSSGDILVNGYHGWAIPRSEYLKHVSVVRQTPHLFTDTVLNNIAYGAVAYRQVTREEVIEAAMMANAHEFIMKLPEGYDTMLGDGAGAVQLSGGQKQRLAIARALLKNASLLVLDEATSALDSESEALVQDALEKLIKGRTVVVIAHRLSTVIHADQIAVVKDGRIAEIGTHQKLMKSKGLYSSLMNTQIGAFNTEAAIRALESSSSSKL